MKDDQHFNRIFYYIAASTGLVILYVGLITFVNIPKENQRFVDISLAFLLGWISSNSQYLTGGNPTTKKETPTVTQTGDSPVVNNVLPVEIDQTKG